MPRRPHALLPLLLAGALCASSAAAFAAPFERGDPRQGLDQPGRASPVPGISPDPKVSRDPKASPDPKTARPERPPPPSLDELFARLQSASDDAEAQGAAKVIERRLARSGSATADLLNERALQAMSGRDFALAAELMDRATVLEPGWSEGWNRRALVFWQLSDKETAIADLKRALVLEPRHFEAWAALGRIYLSLDDKPRALESFRRAQAIYPRMQSLRGAIEKLTPDVDGRDL